MDPASPLRCVREDGAFSNPLLTLFPLSPPYKPMTDESPSNATEFTVSEISGALKRLVEDSFGHVRVRGEISGYRGPHSSGHAYFSLKDDKSRIEAVVWRGSFSKLKFQPEEGMEVIATGKLTTFPGSSKYQIVIEQLEPAGAGALMALLEERKRKLAAEGLFSDANKQLLPYMPKVIGVVTSPTGAVIRDIIHRITDRFPVHVIVWPVRVQGETSGQEVAAAVNGFNELDPELGIPVPDLLIVARGGGSLEDLWGFNDEVVVRAVANSHIPVISAVGHETDWTLIDYAADVRAPTPTGAAEMAVPVKAELEATLASLAARLSGAVSRAFERKRQSVSSAARGLPSPDMLLALPRRRFDEAVTRIERALKSGVEIKHARFINGAGARLNPVLLTRMNERRREQLTGFHDRAFRALESRSIRARQLLERLSVSITPNALDQKVKFGRQRLDDFERRSDKALEIRLHRRGDQINAVWRLAESLSHKRVLARGFALVKDEKGDMVRTAAQVTPGQHLIVEFADAKVAVQETSAGPTPAKPKSRPASSSQGALF
jgi:exodeoxyribonuclease VII large subunit